MDFLLEYKLFFKEGDIVLTEYWYNNMITPVKVIKKINKKSYKISHNIKESKIQNAPDEIIKSTKIIDLYKI